MLIYGNPHTHSNFVDGKNTPEEMVETALSMGFRALGFSEHARQRLDIGCGLTRESELEYIESVLALKEKYAGRIRIWLGTELDRLGECRREKYDYILAANHYLVAEDGACGGVDNGKTFSPFVEGALGGNYIAAYEKYYEEYASYIEEIKPDIIAHFDLVCKYNRTNHYFDEASEHYLSVAKRALDRMIKVCKVLEVNTGGIARSNQPCPYPILPLLTHWHDLGGEVIPSSDCHRAHQLNCWFENTAEYLKQAGFDHMLQLGTGDALFETVSLL